MRSHGVSLSIAYSLLRACRGFLDFGVLLMLPAKNGEAFIHLALMEVCTEAFNEEYVLNYSCMLRCQIWHLCQGRTHISSFLLRMKHSCLGDEHVRESMNNDSEQKR